MNNKGLGCLLVIVIFALLASMAVNVLQFAFHAGLSGGPAVFVHERPNFTETLDDGDKKASSKIARIDLSGIITSQSSGGVFSNVGMDVDSVRHALQQAVNDPTVKAIVLKVNTPGGEVTASDTLYNAVKKAAAQKPVVVYMDTVAASGGYYLSCGATKIVANETSFTGSIGVIIQTLNYTDTMGKLGLESLTFVSGAFKDTLSGSRPMREDERAYVQGLVGQTYEKFLGIVSEARKVDKETLRTGPADGRVLTGKDALDHKLVDQLGYIEDAYALARELGKSQDAMVVVYGKTPSLGALLGIMGEARNDSGKITLDVTSRLLPSLQPGIPYLLPAHMAP